MKRTDRAPGWESRLADVLCVALTRGYDARKWNCARFAHACAEAVSGRPLPFVWRGSLEASADAALPRVAPALAHRGDIVLAQVPEPSLGVCRGRDAVFVTAKGLLSVPMSAARAAWSV